jgi:aspartate racemase
MRTLGLIGGCSAESTAIYYARINRLVRDRAPGHGAKLLLWSFDFEEIDACCQTGDWDLALEKFMKAAHWLQAAGADALLICTNTMHRIADRLGEALDIPLIHIIDETAKAIVAAGRRRPILLGTRFTMQEPFYRERLEAFGLDVRTPTITEREAIHEIIYDELMEGRVNMTDRRLVKRIIDRLAADGADSVILGCTELGMIIGPDDVDVPVFDTAEVHSQAAARFALEETALEQTSLA